MLTIKERLFQDGKDSITLYTHIPHNSKYISYLLRCYVFYSGVMLETGPMLADSRLDTRLVGLVWIKHVIMEMREFVHMTVMSGMRMVDKNLINDCGICDG